MRYTFICRGRHLRKFRSVHRQGIPISARIAKATVGGPKRFIQTARKLDVDETEAGHEKAFGKVGLKKPKKIPKRRQPK